MAAALDKGLITDDQILDAFHSGTDVYQQFIDECTELVGHLAGKKDADQTTKIAESKPSSPHVEPVIALTAQSADPLPGTVEERKRKPTSTKHTNPPATTPLLSDAEQKLLELLADGPLLWHFSSYSWRESKGARQDF
ncbi:MAG: hypothetical protein ACYDBJ_18990 [Aggregatilineales bacterium]